HGGEVYTGVLDLHVSGSGSTDVASRAGEGHPWRRCVDSARMTRIHGPTEQVVSAIKAQVRPVGEAGLRSDPSCRVLEVAVGRSGNTVPGRIYAGENCDDVVGGVRDQWRVMIGKKHAILLEKVEQVRHLFKIGRHQSRTVARGVTHEVRIVEDDSDNMLD